MMGTWAQSPFANRLTAARPDASQGGVRIVDLSALPRIGFKGRGTTDWLKSKVNSLPGQPNRATIQADSTMVAWLGGQEYLILSDTEGKATLVEDTEGAWPSDHATSDELIGYPLPRADSHSWLWLTGADVPAMMAKVCGVDMRPEVFDTDAVAQSVVARIGAILIRADKDGEFGLYMLSDFASAHYLWDVLQDASVEFGGGFV